MEQTSLFQRNLMIWLAWPAPPTGMVNPIFQREGFTLKGIGPSFELPLEIQARATAAGFPFMGRTSPDLLIGHDQRGWLCTIECKPASFGPGAEIDSSKHQAHQAAALLSATGSFLADYIGLPAPADWHGYLLYVVSGGQEEAMLATLKSLAAQSRAARIEPTRVGAIGVYVEDDGVYLRLAPSSYTAIKTLERSSPDSVRVVKLDDAESARPLYLLPWDPSIEAHDDYERRAVEERVRAAFTSIIGTRLDDPTFEVALDEILQDAVDVWRVWHDRDAKHGFRNAVRAYVKGVLAELRKSGVEIRMHQDAFTFSEVTPRIAQLVRGYLVSAAFRRGAIDLWSDAVQLDFGALADGW